MTIFCGFSLRMRPYQPVKHLDSKGDGNGCPTRGAMLLDGRQCTYPCATHYNGGDPRCGSEAMWKCSTTSFTLAPDDKYIRYTMDKAMYLVDEMEIWHSTIPERKDFTTISWERVRYSVSVTASTSTRRKWSLPTMAANASGGGLHSHP